MILHVIVQMSGITVAIALFSSVRRCTTGSQAPSVLLYRNIRLRSGAIARLLLLVVHL